MSHGCSRIDATEETDFEQLNQKIRKQDIRDSRRMKKITSRMRMEHLHPDGYHDICCDTYHVSRRNCGKKPKDKRRERHEARLMKESSDG